MPRRLLAPINTIKHYVTLTNGGTGTGVVRVFEAVDAKSVIADAQDVVEGAIIKAVHYEIWVISNGATGVSSQFMLVIEKVPAGQASITAAQMLSLASYPNKKNIFYTFQGVQGPSIDGSAAIPIYRDWLRIPKGKQRFGLSDRLIASFQALGTGAQSCGLATYKEWK